MRHRFSGAFLLLALILGASGWLSFPDNFPAAILDDQAMAIVRGADLGQNWDGSTQTCDEINAGGGLSKAQCEAAGPFPASDVCVFCMDQPVARVPNPNVQPTAGRLVPTDPYTCSGAKYTGTCVPANPFGGQAQCDLPDMSNGNCSGQLKQYLVQSDMASP